MEQIKTFVPVSMPAETEDQINQYLPSGTKKTFNRIYDKTGVNLYRDRLSNRQACWDYILAKRDADPDSRFLQRLQKDGKLSRKNEPEFILLYMDSINFLEDYNTVCSFEPRELSFYVSHICSTYHLPVPSLFDIFHMDVKQFFSSYTKKNCDKAALAYTSNIQKALETLFKDTTTDERFRIQSCTNLYLYDQAIDFDVMHEILFKP